MSKLIYANLYRVKLLYGRDLAGFIKERQAKQVRNLRQSFKVFPKLAIVKTSNDPVIDTYIRLKESYGNDILIDVDIHSVDQSDLADTIAQLNDDQSVHGVIIQLPLADPSQTEQAVNAVAASKDVDGLGDSPIMTTATPLAIDWLLAGYNVNLADKKIAIVGNGRLVGAPLAKLWKGQGLDVTVFDSQHPVSEELTQYGVIVTAVGQAGIIPERFIAERAIVVDAGTSNDSGTIRGDIEEAAYNRHDLTITPMKGGVGPLTVAALFDNVIAAARATTSASN